MQARYANGYCTSNTHSHEPRSRTSRRKAIRQGYRIRKKAFSWNTSYDFLFFRSNHAPKEIAKTQRIRKMPFPSIRIIEVSAICANDAGLKIEIMPQTIKHIAPIMARIAPKSERLEMSRLFFDVSTEDSSFKRTSSETSKKSLMAISFSVSGTEAPVSRT